MSETVVNDAGADIDFRVEGDTISNLLIVDAGAGQYRDQYNGFWLWRGGCGDWESFECAEWDAIGRRRAVCGIGCAQVERIERDGDNHRSCLMHNAVISAEGNAQWTKQKERVAR